MEFEGVFEGGKLFFYRTWDALATDIIRILQLIIISGIGLRCIFIIKNGRSNEAGWKQIWNQVKGHVFIAVISLVISELVRVFSSYFQ